MGDLFKNKTKEDYIQEWGEKADKAEYFQKMRDASQDLEEQKRLEVEVKSKKLEAESSAFRYRLLDEKESMTAFSLDDMRMPKVPDLSEMKEAHIQRYQLVEKKKGYFKTEVESVPIQKPDEMQVEKKQENKTKLTSVEFQNRDYIRKAEQKISMDSKKKLDFHTVMDISAFYEEFGDNMEAAVNSYSESIDGKRAVLDKMTESILSFDIGKLDLSSDDAVIKNGMTLECLTNKVKSYKKLLDANPEYVSDMGSLHDEIKKKLSSLTDVTNYYRIRKCIIQDPTYASHKNSELPLEINQDDDFATAHIKKLLRASFILSKRLNIAKGNNSDMPELSAVLMETKEYQNKWDKILDEKDKSKVDAGIEDEIENLERESAYVPPEYMKIRLDNIPTENNDKHLAKFFSHTGEMEVGMEMGKEREGFDKLYKNLTDNIPKSVDASFDDATTFNGHLKVANGLSRDFSNFVSIFRDFMSADEVYDLANALVLSRSKEYLEKYKNDPDAKRYCEEKYKDAVMRYSEVYYKMAKQMENAMGDIIYHIHPVDFIMQLNSKLVNAIAMVSGIVNLGDRQFDEWKDFVNKENKDKRYNIDPDEKKRVEHMPSALVMMFNNYNGAMTDAITEGYVSEEKKKEFIAEAKKKTNVKSDGQRLKHYLLEHPEFFNKAGIYKEKRPDGRYWLGNAIIDSKMQLFQSPKAVSDAMKRKGLRHVTKEQLDAYEKHLKESGYPPVGPPDDPYLMKEMREGMPRIFQQKGKFFDKLKDED